MKKIPIPLIFFVVISLVLASCTQVTATPTLPPTEEPAAAPVTEPTAVPTKEPEPTQEPVQAVPTEPAAEPTKPAAETPESTRLPDLEGRNRRGSDRQRLHPAQLRRPGAAAKPWAGNTTPSTRSAAA